MRFLLNKEDKNKLIALFDQFDTNFDYDYYVYKIIFDGDDLEVEKAQALAVGKTPLEKKNFYFDLLEKKHPADNDFIKKNLRWETQILSAKDYEANPYIKALKGISFNEGKYRLDYGTIKAYTICSYGEEYPYGANYAMNMALAMFDDDITYPAIYENGLELITLSPYEIRTLETPIALAKGNVLILGLGIGYYAYMVSLKEEVKEVNIVELDKKLIDVFNKHLLPLFPHPEKIHVHRLDPYAFSDAIEDKEYDFIFANLWQGPTHGASSYLMLKHHFDNFKYTRCVYRLENTILNYLRNKVIDIMKQEYYQIHDDRDAFDSYIASMLEDYGIRDSNDIDSLLNVSGLNKLFSDY